MSLLLRVLLKLSAMCRQLVTLTVPTGRFGTMKSVRDLICASNFAVLDLTQLLTRNM